MSSINLDRITKNKADILEVKKEIENIVNQIDDFIRKI